MLAFSSALLVAACSSQTKGSGTARSTAAATAASPSISSPASSSASATASGSAQRSSPPVSPHPLPAQPIRTATVVAGSHTYRISVWAEVRTPTCADHAYGAVATYLATHPCLGLQRLLAGTSVGGRPVGFNLASLGIPSTSADPYANAVAFRQLVEQDGTGNLTDLLRDGYRLPRGPAAVPSPDAFRALGQDSGVAVFDLWYLDRPTPENDPALLTLAQDVFLQF